MELFPVARPRFDQPPMPFPSMALRKMSVEFRLTYQVPYCFEMLKEDERVDNDNQYKKDTGNTLGWSAFIAGGLIGPELPAVCPSTGHRAA